MTRAELKGSQDVEFKVTRLQRKIGKLLNNPDCIALFKAIDELRNDFDYKSDNEKSGTKELNIPFPKRLKEPKILNEIGQAEGWGLLTVSFLFGGPELTIKSELHDVDLPRYCED